MVLIALGLIDFGGSYANFDLWGGTFGIQLPDTLWQYSAHLELFFRIHLIQGWIR